ncbi:MAG: hypothetical protein MUC41_05150 [Syntrophobacteraceae bacterium]|jgi:putative RNA 2'-phosphotransferase|nr:hypothetical protein [Syntrophobacteraceae bacterium]
MAAMNHPKTLAKTLAYLLLHAPGEYGLFWDEDGSMPWKELYWAMQEDPSLRFVRESHLREIAYLGIDFPARLDGHVLRLKSGVPAPDHPVVHDPPPRLFHGCRRRSLAAAREHGLRATGRRFLAVSADQDLALRMARRRETEPILIEILAGLAARDGIVFRAAGASLYLVENVPAGHLRFPLVSEDRFQELAGRPKKHQGIDKASTPKTPGSFLVEMEHLHGQFGGPPDGSGKPKGRGRRGAEWKRASRNERNKRKV